MNRITHDTKRATNTPISISSVNLAKHKKEPLLLTDKSANDNLRVVQQQMQGQHLFFVGYNHAFKKKIVIQAVEERHMYDRLLNFNIMYKHLTKSSP